MVKKVFKKTPTTTCVVNRMTASIKMKAQARRMRPMTTRAVTRGSSQSKMLTMRSRMPAASSRTT